MLNYAARAAVSGVDGEAVLSLGDLEQVVGVRGNLLVLRNRLHIRTCNLQTNLMFDVQHY